MAYSKSLVLRHHLALYAWVPFQIKVQVAGLAGFSFCYVYLRRFQYRWQFEAT